MFLCSKHFSKCDKPPKIAYFPDQWIGIETQIIINTEDPYIPVPIVSNRKHNHYVWQPDAKKEQTFLY